MDDVAGLAVVVDGLGVGLHVDTLLEARGQLKEKLQLLQHAVPAAQLVDRLAPRGLLSACVCERAIDRERECVVCMCVWECHVPHHSGSPLPAARQSPS